MLTPGTTAVSSDGVTGTPISRREASRHDRDAMLEAACDRHVLRATPQRRAVRLHAVDVLTSQRRPECRLARRCTDVDEAGRLSARGRHALTRRIGTCQPANRRRDRWGQPGGMSSSTAPRRTCIRPPVARLRGSVLEPGGASDPRSSIRGPASDSDQSRMAQGRASDATVGEGSRECQWRLTSPTLARTTSAYHGRWRCTG